MVVVAPADGRDSQVETEFLLQQLLMGPGYILHKETPELQTQVLFLHHGRGRLMTSLLSKRATNVITWLRVKRKDAYITEIEDVVETAERFGYNPMQTCPCLNLLPREKSVWVPLVSDARPQIEAKIRRELPNCFALPQSSASQFRFIRYLAPAKADVLADLCVYHTTPRKSFFERSAALVFNTQQQAFVEVVVSPDGALEPHEEFVGYRWRPITANETTEQRERRVVARMPPLPPINPNTEDNDE